MRPALCLLVALLGSLLMTCAEAQTPPATAPSYSELLRELQPRMVFEVTEANLNRYLTAHQDQFSIPEGFSAPYVSLAPGLFEVSALTKLLFVPTRVRVSMRPQVEAGRLRLQVYRIHAGPVRLPSSFHHGVADTIARAINEMLERNEVQLLGVETARGLLRVTAQACPPAPAEAPPAGGNPS